MEWAVTGGGELAVKVAGTQKWRILTGEGRVSLVCLCVPLPAVIWILWMFEVHVNQQS